MSRFDSISANLSEIKDKLSDSTKLIAISKTFPSSDILLAYQAGQRHFGENKVQELLEKANELKDSCPDICWHFVGHLQSNKINNLLKVPNLSYIHSISSLSLAQKLANKEIGKELKLFLQVNTSGEDEKDGFENLSGLEKAKNVIESNKLLSLVGLMTIGTIRTEDFADEAKRCFQKLVDLQKDLDGKLQLSMGMTSDFEIAIQYKSNWVRIGRKIFGSR